jgi:D-alanyl-D-alanine carboxypeptidase (penicillin-binding protein 5/6)
MNKIARDLNLYNTRYDNPHGLMNKNNRSSASDISKLAAHAMKLADFREIVS